jgi:hypothetical protein
LIENSEQLKKERYKMGQDNELKIFEDKKIRAKWVDEEEKWYFSVVDVISVLTDNDYQKARNYWKWLKGKLNEEGSELVSNTNQFDALFAEFALQIFPVVTTLGIILFIVDGPHNVRSRKPPLIVLFVPNGAYLTVVKKTDRLFAHAIAMLIILHNTRLVISGS